MSLQFVQDEFRECVTCSAKLGAPTLCAECLERREFHSLLAWLRSKELPREVAVAISVCGCRGAPGVECAEHGR